MDWDNWKTRFGQDSVKVFFGAAIILAIGLGAYAVLQENPDLLPGNQSPEFIRNESRAEGVKLLPSEAELPPRSTFRIQFDKSVVEADQVGAPGQKSPLVFDPPLEGEFVWDSTRSGEFIPSAGFDLDRQFTVRLTKAIAKQTGLQIRRHFHTPPMQVKAQSLRYLNSDKPFRAAIAFNVAMNPETAASFVQFQSKSGERIPASIEAMTDDNHCWLDAPHKPWSMRMSGTTANPEANPTRMIIRPRSILTPGTEWELLLKSGMPSGDGNHLPDDLRINLGKRERMAIEFVSADNQLNQGRSINIRLNYSLPPEFTGKELSQWLKLERVEAEGPGNHLRFHRTNFKASNHGSSITLKGDFELDCDYRVVIRRGLPAKLGLAMEDEHFRNVQFKPLPSRIYLPGNYFSQAANGNRRFSFVTVNNDAVRLRVKRIAPDQLTKVLEVYKNEYMDGGRINWSRKWVWRKGKQLSIDLIPGKLVYDRVFKSKTAVDVSVKKEFSWDELLGDDISGPLFVSVESVGRDSTASGAQVIAQLTDIGLVWKQAAGRIHVQAFSLRTAKPLADAQVQLIGADDSERITGRTNEEGQLIFDSDGKGIRPHWLEASNGNDRHAIQLGRRFAEIPLWNFDIHYGWGDPETRRVHLFTDRLVYQPGDSVRLKGHVRDLVDGRLEIPDLNALPIKAKDWRGHTFYSQQIDLSDRGSFHTDIQLPKGVSGNFSIQAGDQRHYITVHEYEPATFKLRFPGQQQFAPDASIEMPLEAHYYFGKSLADAKVAWSLTVHRWAFEPARWDEFDFGDSEFGNTSDLSDEGKLSEHGKFLIQPQITPDPESPMPVNGRCVVRVTDANGQSISGSTPFIRHSSDYYFASRRLSRVRWAGQPVPLQIVAVNSDGSPHPAGQQAAVSLKKIEWHSVKMKGAGGVVRYKNERKLVPIAEVKMQTVSRDADPLLSKLVPPEPGRYQLEIRGADASGRPIQNITTFYVRGEKPLAWDYRNEFHMEMVADREIYQPGDTATILLKTPISGRALVSVEREKVLRSFSVDVQGNAPAIEVPLLEADAPNVFVSVMLLRGSESSKRKIKTAEYRVGYCELKVERPESRLNVQANLPRSNFQPGENVEVELNVSDHTGRSIPGAEVTLYAVDEGVLDLTGYEAPDLHSFFYAPRTLEISTSTSFAFMRTEDPNRIAYGNKGHIIGGGGGGTSKLRRKFLAVAFWNATLRADADGQIRASFTAPDSLTRYRLIAVAHSGDRFGTVETGFQIHQPLMVESALPRFGRVGDRLTAKAMVYNQTDQPLEAEVKLELDDAIIAGGKLQRQITIPPQGIVPVNFPLEFMSTGKARTVWWVRCLNNPKLADARESFIDIRHVAPLRRAVHFLRLTGAKTDLLKPLDPILRQAKGEYTVSVSTSPMAELDTAADYLLMYPHGCLEQTSSRLLPWLLLEGYEDVFPRFKSDSPKADEVIERGINRLLSMQDHSGGLAYWPGRSASLFASAYGGMLLAIAQERGHDVPDGPMKSLTRYLTKKVKGPISGKNDGDHCLALYTLALLQKPQPACHERLYVNRDQLSTSGRALLAMAIAKVNGPKEMMRELLKPAKSNQRGFAYFGNASQITGMRLLALSLVEADSQAAAQLAGKLVGSMREGHWGTTFANAWAMYGMSVYARRHQFSDQTPATGTLLWRTQAQPFKLEDGRRRLVFTFENQPGGKEAPLLLRNETGRILFVQVRASMYPAVRQTKPVKRGISIHRTFTRLKDDGSEDDSSPLRVGDLVRVTLQVDIPSVAQYFAIEDGLPANLEPLNAKLKTQRTARSSGEHRWYISHQVLRKDRAVFYANHLPRGSHHFKYLARVRAAGLATAPAAMVEAMYDPEILGLTPSQPIQTLPLND